ncbi:MAG TPA: histidine kinase dimerization/phospho-acceptor domain-containing protein [Candidatus Acidoferrales bacterium]
MTPWERVVLLVSADSELAQQWMEGLMSGDGLYQLPMAANLAQARHRLWRVTPLVILLDETAVYPDAGRVRAGGQAESGSLELAVRELATVAPVVLVCAPESLGHLDQRGDLAVLVRDGRLDVVQRAAGAGRGHVALSLSLVERRLAAAEGRAAARDVAQTGSPVLAAAAAAVEPPPDFGEVLRHEVNNPLTGILGNAELLLARRDRLPATAVQRLQVIADLAVRLRETVRRLSNAWEERHARSA